MNGRIKSVSFNTTEDLFELLLGLQEKTGKPRSLIMHEILDQWFATDAGIDENGDLTILEIEDKPKKKRFWRRNRK